MRLGIFCPTKTTVPRCVASGAPLVKKLVGAGAEPAAKSQNLGRSFAVLEIGLASILALCRALRTLESSGVFKQTRTPPSRDVFSFSGFTIALASVRALVILSAYLSASSKSILTRVISACRPFRPSLSSARSAEFISLSPISILNPAIWDWSSRFSFLRRSDSRSSFAAIACAAPPKLYASPARAMEALAVIFASAIAVSCRMDSLPENPKINPSNTTSPITPIITSRSKALDHPFQRSSLSFLYSPINPIATSAAKINNPSSDNSRPISAPRLSNQSNKV